jgi:hypothetical protein
MTPKYISESKINLLNSIKELSGKVSNNELLVATFPGIAPDGANNAAADQISTVAGAHVHRRFRVRPEIADLTGALAGLGAAQ